MNYNLQISGNFTTDKNFLGLSTSTQRQNKNVSQKQEVNNTVQEIFENKINEIENSNEQKTFSIIKNIPDVSPINEETKENIFPE